LKLRFCLAAITLIALAGDLFAFQIEGVPFVKQDLQQCGPASLASVLSFYGVSVPLDSITEATYNEKLKGSLITDLQNFARRLGFRTESAQGTVEKMKTLIDQKKPVIVLIDIGFWFASKPHYLVLFGYSEKGFIAHDGKKASQGYEHSDFRRMWGKMGSPYLLVYR